MIIFTVVISKKGNHDNKDNNWNKFVDKNLFRGSNQLLVFPPQRHLVVEVYFKYTSNFLSHLFHFFPWQAFIEDNALKSILPR